MRSAIRRHPSLIWITLMGCLLVGSHAGARAGLAEGEARGYPVLRDAQGRKLADGEFVQWLEGGRLRVSIVYDFGDGRRVEERAVLRQQPLAQETWSWRETRGTTVLRRYEVNIGRGQARAEKLGEDGRETWTEHVDADPARTFAGIGFSYAVRQSRSRLREGEVVELETVGFTPKPRAVKVEIAHAGVDRMSMGGRTLRGDRFVIHPKLPWLADLFVDVPDATIWLITPPPAGFLRFEGPLAEPDDPIVRIDLLPGGPSGPARPVGARASTRR